MTYSEKELQQIEKFASIYLKISDIAVILDIPADVLREDIADRTSEVSKAYRRGKAGSKVKLHSFGRQCPHEAHRQEYQVLLPYRKF